MRTFICILGIYSLLSGQTCISQGSGVGSNYLLSPGDLVSIRVFQEEDLSVEQRLAKDGTISFPLIGQVKIGGRTVAGASQLIAELLRDGYLVSPQVSLTIATYTSKRFVVLGQVQKPGSYEFPTEQTVGLLEAIAMAGGYTRIANPSKVTIKRKVKGAEKVIPINAKSLANSSEVAAFEVLPDDTIVVPESLF
jgi:polysaccharide export outer membrane protein